VFHHIKGYLKKKDSYVLLFYAILAAASVCVVVANERGRNEFEILDVPNESCLLLCSHITMLALLFVDQAFAALFLTSSKQLFRLRIASGQKQLPMPLKKKMAKRSLFQRCKNIVKSIQISKKQALANISLRLQMTNLGSIIGMKLFTNFYTFRRDNDQALDNSSKSTMIVGRISCLLVGRRDYRRAAKHHFATSQFLRLSEELRLEIHA
jgi:NAD-dependent DNA ligase